MAEKQFARSETIDLSTFADDDPLSELARIVTHDHRPAVEQLKELERHREAMRFDPVVDLEEELLREFDAYDAPVAPPVAVEPERRAAAPAPRAVEPRFAAEPKSEAAARREPLPVFDHAEPEMAPVMSKAPIQPIASYDTAFDLERELTLSMEAEADAPVVPAPVAAAPVVAPAMPAPVVPAPVVSASVSARPVAPAEPARRAAYPFTPNFSRATPVAGGMQGQGRTFATPLPQAPAAPVAVAPAVVAPAAVAAPVEPSFEPDFDLAAFELDLAEAAMEIEVAQPEQPARAPVAAAPAPVYQPAPSAPVEDFFEELPEIELPFDPSMIADADDAPPAAADFDVPQLPVIEESRPVLDQGDYDLDIDAEMAHLFADQQSAKTRAAPAARAETAETLFAEPARPAASAYAAAPSSAYAQPAHLQAAAAQAAPAAPRAAMPGFGEPARAPLPEVDDFEQVMNVDFRRSMRQRQEVLADGEIPEPRALYAHDEPARSSRRLILMASAAIVVLVAGGAAAFTYLSGASTPFSSGEPQVILADKSPTKMVPVDKGGKTVPNQDKAVYDRVAGAAQESPVQDTLVSSTEEPIDVVQRTLTPETMPLQRGEEGDDMAMATPIGEDGDRLLPEEGGVSVAEEDAKPAVEPRKVRTMIVKPDGTLVAREEMEGQDSSPLISTVKTTALKTSEPATDVTTATTRPIAEANAESLGALEAAASATAKVAKPAVSVREPVPSAKPVEVAKAAPAVVDTFATPASTASDAAPSEAPARALPAGSYVVQIASLPSEADAKASSTKMASKFGSVIGGRAMDIKKAEIAGKGTYYRVRVQGGSKDEANALCAKLKSAGGSCLVTR
ncbi:SPOR domain-containing protein [Rhizobium sp. CC-YZS058]|uniref:SPOR domain-containing protein n=1 Tax=Rhizobium sp. CC-YZS058 TaxID=3042153 RepID=UPI002B061FE4|nr:SPOR domain-containing protein [Rhizobium sp. CC-YZS058]MEA3534788.1 SPOR domain-containing protein [Rhizobium sp. CC-YZS058]